MKEQKIRVSKCRLLFNYFFFVQFFKLILYHERGVDLGNPFFITASAPTSTAFCIYMNFVLQFTTHCLERLQINCFGRLIKPETSQPLCMRVCVCVCGYACASHSLRLSFLCFLSVRCLSFAYCERIESLFVWFAVRRSILLRMSPRMLISDVLW